MVTARERARENRFKDYYFEEKGVLYCKICLVPINHHDITTCRRHLEGKKHIDKLEKIKKDENLSNKRQRSMDTVMTVQQKKEMFCEDFTAMCILANIPLEKVCFYSLELFWFSFSCSNLEPVNEAFFGKVHSHRRLPSCS